MRVTVKIGDVAREGRLPESERWIDVAVRCPLCDNATLPVIGDKRRQTVGHDTVTAPALSMCCGQEVGTVLVELSTIFGLEEDERVLHGRPRVY
jgi:hypothetical protein